MKNKPNAAYIRSYRPIRCLIAHSAVRIIKDTDGRCKGYGFIGFQSPEIVREVIEKMDGMEVEGRNIKVNETKSDGYRPSPYDARDRDRDRDRDRSRQPQSDSYHPPPDPSGRKYRISINNLPEHFTWRELKDFLRTGAQSVSYANVSRPGFGCVLSFIHCWFLITLFP